MADLALSDEQELLKDAFARFFSKEATTDHVRAAEPLGFDPTLWERLRATGAHAMRADGNASVLDLAIVAEEFGRTIAPVPLVEAAVATGLLDRLGPPELASDAVAGSIIATLALQPAVAGVAHLVPAGAVADVVVALDGGQLVAAQRTSGRRPYVASPANLACSPMGDFVLAGDWVRRVVLCDGDEARAAYDAACDEWRALMASALVGLGSTALSLGLDYIKDRTAFGVTIAHFQAVQHRLADVVTGLDGARLLALEAAWAIDEHAPQAASLATMAFVFAADKAFAATRESLQFHGGYGYTVEYDIQLFFRRAKGWPLAAGSRLEVIRRAAQLELCDSGRADGLS